MSPYKLNSVQQVTSIHVIDFFATYQSNTNTHLSSQNMQIAKGFTISKVNSFFTVLLLWLYHKLIYHSHSYFRGMR